MKAFIWVVLVSVIDLSVSFQEDWNDTLQDGLLCCGGGSCTTKCKDGLTGGKTITGEPPRFVYRADFRTPTDVFSKGFKCLGQNDNLVEHTKGISTHYGDKHDSIFVSTSSVAAMAAEWAKTIITKSRDPKSNAFKYRNNRSIFVYKIQADWNYFNMAESLLAEDTADSRQQAEHVAKKFEEWEACGGIKAKEVESATEYVWGSLNNPNQPIRNNGYADLDTRASSSAYVSG